MSTVGLTLGELEGDTVEGANVCPVTVGICVVGELVGDKELGLDVGRLEGLLVGFSVAGLAAGEL